MNKLSFLVLIPTLGALLLMTPASAQTIANSFSGFSQKNNNQPIDIEADSLEVLDDKKYAIFTGNVKARQGKFVLVAKRLKVTYQGGLGQKKKGQRNAVKWIEASGKVAITTPDGQSATSDRARFDVASRKVIIAGNVILSQSGTVMRGDKLMIDLKTGRSRFNAQPHNTASGKKKKRITGVFIPGKMKNNGLLDKKKSGGNRPKRMNSMQQQEIPPVPALKDLQ